MVFCNLSYPLKKITLIFWGVLIFNGVLQAAGNQEQPVDTTLNRLLRGLEENTEAAPEEDAEAVTAEDTVKSNDVSYPYMFRKVPDSVITGLQRKKEFAYANDPAYWLWGKEPREEKLSGSIWPLLQLFVYLLLIIAFIYAFYNIVVSNKLHLFYSSSKNKKGETGAGEEMGEDVDQKINDCITAGEYRLAIRYMYIKTLRMLDEKGWIIFNAQSTNIDYVNALNKRPDGELFRFITKNYEYVWYGEFELKSEHFSYLHKKFETFYKNIR